MYFLGIDISTRDVGICLINEKEKVIYTEKLFFKKDITFIEKAKIICDWFKEFNNQYKTKIKDKIIVFIERSYYQGNIIYGQLKGYLYEITGAFGLLFRSNEVFFVSPSEWMSFIDGYGTSLRNSKDGKLTKKQKENKAIVFATNNTGYNFEDSDIADACLIAIGGKRKWKKKN